MLKIAGFIFLFLGVFSCNIMDEEAHFNSDESSSIPIFYLDSVTSSITWDKKNQVEVCIVENEDSIKLNGKAKFRGGISSRYYKHSFTLDLDEPKSIGKLPKRRRWILNANYIDKTFMRHKLSFDLFNMMHEENIAPSSRYVEVYKNNHYLGLYVLMERVNDEMLYSYTNATYPIVFKEPAIFYSSLKSINEKNVFNQKNPSVKEKDFNDEIEKIHNLIHFSSDEIFSEQIFLHLDQRNIIDWHLILLFSNNSDGLLKNFYIYKLNELDTYKFALWDYDHSFGRDGDNEMNMLERMIDVKRITLFKRLIDLNVNNYNDLLSKRWEILTKSVLKKEVIDSMILSNKKIIQPYIEKNNKVWPVTDTTWYFDTNDFYDEVEIMKKYIEKRLPQLNEL